MISRTLGASQAEIQAKCDRARIWIDESVVDAARERIGETKDFGGPVRVGGKRVQVLNVQVHPGAGRSSHSLGKHRRESVTDYEILDARVTPVLQPAIGNR